MSVCARDHRDRQAVRAPGVCSNRDAVVIRGNRPEDRAAVSGSGECPVITAVEKGRRRRGHLRPVYSCCTAKYSRKRSAARSPAPAMQPWAVFLRSIAQLQHASTAVRGDIAVTMADEKITILRSGEGSGCVLSHARQGIVLLESPAEEQKAARQNHGRFQSEV